jgi:hypothetical protein
MNKIGHSTRVTIWPRSVDEPHERTEGDRLRRLRQRLGDRDYLKLEPLVSLKQRVAIGCAPLQKSGRWRRCVARTDVTVETERNRTEVTAAGLCQSPTSWSIVQERVELLPVDLVQVPWRNETGDVVASWGHRPLCPTRRTPLSKERLSESITNTSASSDMLLLDTDRRTAPHPLHPLSPTAALLSFQCLATGKQPHWDWNPNWDAVQFGWWSLL